jgi:MFS family permease
MTDGKIETDGVSAQFTLAPPEPSRVSERGLDYFNLFLAGLLAGFGPFVAGYLSSEHWSKVEIGFVLTLAGLVGLVSQIPGGELLDRAPAKRLIAALGVSMVALAALVLALNPTFPFVLAAEILQGVTGGFLGPAVAAISLGLVGHDALPVRLGRNQRFAAIGGLSAALLMGLLGYEFSNRAIFLAAAALAVPTLIALRSIRSADIHFARACNAPPGKYHTKRPPRTPRMFIGMNLHLVVFACGITLFQFANASMLPLAAEELGSARSSSLILSILITVPQLIVAALGPWVGRTADSWGRRPLLLIGLSVLPLRAACFALSTDPALLVAAQVLDGISGSVIGVLTPLVVADITKGSGRFNLAQGMVGTFSGIGAAVSTTAINVVAQNFGNAAGFMAIAAVALAAVAVQWAWLPETKQPYPVQRPPTGFGVQGSTT